MNAYRAVIEEVPAAAASIKDIYMASNPETAALAAQMAYTIFHSLKIRFDNQLHNKSQTIEQLRADKEVLIAVKNLVRQVY